METVFSNILLPGNHKRTLKLGQKVPVFPADPTGGQNNEAKGGQEDTSRPHGAPVLTD